MKSGWLANQNSIIKLLLWAVVARVCLGKINMSERGGWNIHAITIKMNSIHENAQTKKVFPSHPPTPRYPEHTHIASSSLRSFALVCSAFKRQFSIFLLPFSISFFFSLFMLRRDNGKVFP
jgi:hypothetical protein